MTEPAHSIAFFDRDRQLYGTARSGATLLFEGSKATVLGHGPDVDASGDSLRAALPGRFELALEPVAAEADLDGARVRVCRVRGRCCLRFATLRVVVARALLPADRTRAAD